MNEDPEIIQARAAYNRTKVELKPCTHALYLHDFVAAYNRTKVELKHWPVNPSTGTLTAYNRTKVELKQLPHHWKRRWPLPYNRTKVELKHCPSRWEPARVTPYNRTKVELKPYDVVCRVGHDFLIIGPKWNWNTVTWLGKQNLQSLIIGPKWNWNNYSRVRLSVS